MPRVKSFQAGEWGAGNRVNVFPRRGCWWMEWREADGARKRQSLGRCSATEAKAKAERKASDLRLPSHDRSSPLLFETLVRMYLAAKTPQKGRTCQQHDRATGRRLLRFFGPARDVASIRASDLERYREWRLRTGSEAPGRAKGRPLSERAVAVDLATFRAMCTWACVEGHLSRNPMTGYKIQHGEAHRPTTTTEEFDRRCAVADEEGPQVRLLLNTVYQTGHRVGAVRQLRWTDLDLNVGTVVWQGRYDKKGRTHMTPLTPTALADLREAKNAATSEWVFPSPTNPAVPMNRHYVRDLWERLERRAGLPHVQGRGWHSLRRRFATDFRHLPLAELRDLGGWKDDSTITKCYQHPDQKALAASLATRRLDTNSDTTQQQT